jgi:hypothetical protein
MRVVADRLLARTLTQLRAGMLAEQPACAIRLVRGRHG